MLYAIMEEERLVAHNDKYSKKLSKLYRKMEEEKCPEFSLERWSFLVTK